jgi:class 3 adenylate cyclase
MIDAPHRVPPRFPPELEETVYREICAFLEREDCRIGFSSAACGSDILFLEAILKMGGEAHIVLPCGTEMFRQSSVNIAHGSDWSSRYDRVLEKATDVLNVSPQKSSAGNALYEYANLMLYGLASIRADLLETSLVPLAVWDGGYDGGLGGTADCVERWISLGHEVKIIDLAKILSRYQARIKPRRSSRSGPRLRRRPSGTPEESSMRIIAVLFADVVQYTRLTEEEVPRFVGHFLGMVSDLMATSGNAPEVKNTWGDGLFFAFPSVRAAGLFALDLSERVQAIKWEEKGLPSELSIRIALHAGPVYPCFDPVTQQDTYMGSHVSRAARIEPITPPGKVYASQAFAALAKTEHTTEFKCEYVGQTPLAKGYGTYPTFHVRRCAP